MKRTALLTLALLSAAVAPALAVSQETRPKHIVLIAGLNDHGPEGNGIHDYSWSARLLKAMLETSNIKDKVRVSMHLYGELGNLKSLEDADTIMLITGGRDGHLFQEAPHLASPERVRFFGEQMKRGCGLATFHFSTFTPNQYAREVLTWTGGFFQWETEGKRKWHSAITTAESDVRLLAPKHPVLRGVKPFKLREEFYYNLRFDSKDKRVTPLLEAAALKGRKPDGNVVAWVREREDGGRGFGTTCGHFYANWKNDDFRRMILNSLAWTAKVEVPKEGVQAKFYTNEELRTILGDQGGFKANPVEKDKKAKSVKVLLLAGNTAHKWHNWEKTTPAIKACLEKDSRIQVDVALDIEELARRDLKRYNVVVQNYVNWHDPRGLSEKAKTAFLDFVRDGGGLLVIHFANGAFHFSLPMAGESEWPEYRQLVRRVWDHKGKSGHDPFGRFQVKIAAVKHPITEGLKNFDVDDELYFRQVGAEGIEPLLTAKSRVTGKEEPLAWVHGFGKGKVFQILLGHSEKTYDAAEAREILRRAAVWAARP